MDVRNKLKLILENKEDTDVDMFEYVTTGEDNSISDMEEARNIRNFTVSTSYTENSREVVHVNNEYNWSSASKSTFGGKLAEEDE